MLLVDAVLQKPSYHVCTEQTALGIITVNNYNANLVQEKIKKRSETRQSKFSQKIKRYRVEQMQKVRRQVCTTDDNKYNY